MSPFWHCQCCTPATQLGGLLWSSEEDFSKLSLLWSMLGSRRGFLACQPHFVCTCEGPEAVDAACCSSKLLAETCVCPSHSGLCLATCRARRRALTRAHLCKADLWGQSRGGRSSTKLEQSEWVDAALLKLCYCRRSHEEVRQRQCRFGRHQA